ncbi:MAG: hypothetical protein ABWZ25_00640 [Chitinophagaceae bacterium]
MKKIAAGLLLLPFLAFVTVDWVTVKLDDRATVSFPAEPESRDLSGNIVRVKDVDKDARCMAMTVDFTQFGMDSAGLAKEMENEQSLEQFREGALGQIAGSTLISERRGITNGKTYFEYVINMGKTDPEALNIMYSRNIFAGSKMYTLSFYEKDKRPREEDRNKFLNSFKLLY